MPAAVAAILDGMPDARDLHRLDSGGQTSVFAGSVQLFRYAEDDTAMRNMAVAVLRQLGFGGAEVAAVMGLTPNYVATLHQRSLREGTAGLVRQAGPARGAGGGGGGAGPGAGGGGRGARGAWPAGGAGRGRPGRRRGSRPGRGGRPGCGIRRSRGGWGGTSPRCCAGWAGLTCRSRSEERRGG